MKRLFLVLALLFSASLLAQAPTAVPILQEPHHNLVLENEYVRVFRVSVPPHESTLLHQHDAPYLYVALGAADVINAVQGRPEVRLVMADGQLGYSPGHFAHIARNNLDTPFDNVTIELLHPQGEGRNLCEKIVEGPLNVKNCSSTQPVGSVRVKALSDFYWQNRLFETDDILAVFASLTTKIIDTAAGARRARLLVAYDRAELRIDLPGGTSTLLHGGEILWLSPGRIASISNLAEHGTSRYLVISFKDKEDTKKP
jgi:hypothetical protein